MTRLNETSGMPKHTADRTPQGVWSATHPMQRLDDTTDQQSRCQALRLAAVLAQEGIAPTDDQCYDLALLIVLYGAALLAMPGQLMTLRGLVTLTHGDNNT